MADPDEDQGLPQDVLQEFAARLDEEPDLKDQFILAFKRMSATTRRSNMTDNYKPHITALARIAHLKPLAEIYVGIPEFLKDSPANLMAGEMLLGPYFSISPLQEEAFMHYFSNAKSRSAVELRDTTKALQMATKALQEDLTAIVTAFCKTSDQARSNLLEFFARIINANKKRMAINVDRTAVSPDGFMLNINAVLTKLCEPFMDASFSKVRDST